MTTYQGWSNKETYSVAMWITNDHRLYRSAIAAKSYDNFVDRMHKRGIYETEDGVSLTDTKLNRDELKDIWELRLDEVC